MAKSYLAIALLGAACWTTPRPAPPRRDVTLALDVESAELPNGLRVVVVPEAASSEVTVTVRYAVGTADDPPGKEGLAHLVEHLAYEQPRGDRAIFDALELRALGFNGFTTLDATIYTEHGAPSLLAELLELEAARVADTCIAIPDASFDRQRDIVRNELLERETDQTVRAELESAVFSSNHPFGAWAATADTLAAITKADACAFMHEHYGAGGAVVVLSGRVSLADARAGLERTLGRLPRSASRRPTIPAPSARRRLTIDAPLDRTWHVLAWPLPEQPASRARVRALVDMAATLVDARVNAIVTRLELGAGSERFGAIAIAPSRDISADDALTGAENAIARISPWFGSGLYEHAKNRAVYHLLAALDHGLERDLALAEDAASGRDPRTVIDDELHALVAMSRGEAEDLAHSSLDVAGATIVTLRPSRSRSGAGNAFASTFREGRRRTPEDPAEAHRAATITAGNLDPMTRARELTLADGLHVILLPMSAMPTVDIRLVFPVGTGDEQSGQRGIALLAAQALSPLSGPDLLRFAQAGGRIEQEVGFDHTAFVVRGLSANYDVLLSGLAETVHYGIYVTDSLREAASWEAMASASDARDRVAVSALRSALYGADHPYHHAGRWYLADRDAMKPDALFHFHDTHYVPNGATLIMAGSFDPDEARRWIQYAFADWTGTAPPRKAPPALLRPLAFGQARDSAQVDVTLAFPATGSRAGSLVIAEMIDEALSDVREQLAASYGLHARLVEARMSTTIEIDGAVDAARAGEVFTLVRDRLEKLRAPSDETAALFVSARRHVLGHLRSLDTNASELADLFVLATDLGESLDWQGVTADSTAVLTIDSVQPLLARIELPAAAMLLRGPRSALDAASAAMHVNLATLEP